MLKRLISSTLSVIFFVGNGVLAHAQESNLWQERRKNQLIFARLPVMPDPSNNPTLLPRQTASIQALASHSKSKKVVFHIQDVHQNEEAQNNIADTLQQLIRDHQVDLVAVEGAFGRLDIQNLRNFPRPEAIRSVAADMLKEGKISGPIKTALSAFGTIPPFVGVDDKDLYEANVKTVRDATLLRKAAHEEIADRIRQNNIQKQVSLPPDLKALDENISKYRRNQTSLGQHLLFLKTRSASLSPEIRKYVNALALENTISFTDADVERTRLLARLAGRLNSSESARLVSVSRDFQLARTDQSAFYAFIKDLCESKGISLDEFPHIKSYITYVLSSADIDSQKLFMETKALETRLYEQSIHSANHRRLIQKSQFLILAEKLIDFSLTRDEWQEYAHLKSDMDLDPFEAFYRYAEARDAAMTKNLIAAMTTYNGRSAVLVTGGFHSSGISSALQKNDIRAISFSPKITKLDLAGGLVYLNDFTQEKTSLEKLFEGQKLFLAKNPLSDLERFEFVHRVAGPLLQNRNILFENFQTWANRAIPNLFVLSYRNRNGTLTLEEELTQPDGRKQRFAVTFRGFLYDVLIAGFKERKDDLKKGFVEHHPVWKNRFQLLNNQRTLLVLSDASFGLIFLALGWLVSHYLETAGILFLPLVFKASDLFILHFIKPVWHNVINAARMASNGPTSSKRRRHPPSEIAPFATAESILQKHRTLAHQDAWTKISDGDLAIIDRQYSKNGFARNDEDIDQIAEGEFAISRGEIKSVHAYPCLLLAIYHPQKKFGLMAHLSWRNSNSRLSYQRMKEALLTAGFTEIDLKTAPVLVFGKQNPGNPSEGLRLENERLLKQGIKEQWGRDLKEEEFDYGEPFLHSRSVIFDMNTGQWSPIVNVNFSWKKNRVLPVRMENIFSNALRPQAPSIPLVQSTPSRKALTLASSTEIAQVFLSRHTRFKMWPVERFAQLLIAPWYEIFFTLLPWFALLHNNKSDDGRWLWTTFWVRLAGHWGLVLLPMVLTFLQLPTDNFYLKIAAAFAANIAGHFTHNYLFSHSALTIPDDILVMAQEPFWEKWKRITQRYIDPYWGNHIEHSHRNIRKGIETCPVRHRAIVLGAGECNDIPLEELAKSFKEVHLFDLDKSGMEIAKSRLPFAIRDRVIVHEQDITSGRSQQLKEAGLKIIGEESTSDAASKRLQKLFIDFDPILNPKTFEYLEADYVVSSLNAIQLFKAEFEDIQTAYILKFHDIAEFQDDKLMENIERRHLEFLVGIAKHGTVYVALEAFPDHINPDLIMEYLSARLGFLFESPWAKSLPEKIQAAMAAYLSALMAEKIDKDIDPMLSAMVFNRPPSELEVLRESYPSEITDLLGDEQLSAAQSLELIRSLTEIARQFSVKTDSDRTNQFPAGHTVTKMDTWDYIQNPLPLQSSPIEAFLIQQPQSAGDLVRRYSGRLHELPDEYAHLLRRHFVEGIKKPDLAREMGIHRNSIRIRFRTALNLFNRWILSDELSPWFLVRTQHQRLKDLSPRQAQVLNGIYIEGKSKGQLSDELNISTDLIRQYEYFGLERLRQLADRRHLAPKDFVKKHHDRLSELQKSHENILRTAYLENIPILTLAKRGGIGRSQLVKMAMTAMIKFRDLIALKKSSPLHMLRTHEDKLENLDSFYAEPLRKYYFQGLSLPKIGAELGISASSVLSRIRTGLTILERLVEHGRQPLPATPDSGALTRPGTVVYTGALQEKYPRLWKLFTKLTASSRLTNQAQTERVAQRLIAPWYEIFFTLLPWFALLHNNKGDDGRWLWTTFWVRLAGHWGLVLLPMVLTFVHVPTDNVYLKIAAAFAANIAGHFTHNYLFPTMALTESRGINKKRDFFDYVSLHREKLKALQEKDADVLRLRFIERKKHKDIAAILEIPLSSVDSRLTSAIKKLQFVVASGGESLLVSLRKRPDILDQLEIKDKTLLTRLFLNGESLTQLANENGISITTIAKHRDRAIKRFKALSQDTFETLPQPEEQKERVLPKTTSPIAVASFPTITKPVEREEIIVVGFKEPSWRENAGRRIGVEEFPKTLQLRLQSAQYPTSRILIAIEYLKWTKEEFQKRSGIDPTTLLFWEENPEIQPQLQTVEAAGKALKINPLFIWTGLPRDEALAAVDTENEGENKELINRRAGYLLLDSGLTLDEFLEDEDWTRERIFAFTKRIGVPPSELEFGQRPYPTYLVYVPHNEMELSEFPFSSIEAVANILQKKVIAHWKKRPDFEPRWVKMFSRKPGYPGVTGFLYHASPTQLDRFKHEGLITDSIARAIVRRQPLSPTDIIFLADQLLFGFKDLEQLFISAPALAPPFDGAMHGADRFMNGFDFLARALTRNRVLALANMAPLSLEELINALRSPNPEGLIKMKMEKTTPDSGALTRPGTVVYTGALQEKYPRLWKLFTKLTASSRLTNQAQTERVAQRLIAPWYEIFFTLLPWFALLHNNKDDDGRWLWTTFWVRLAGHWGLVLLPMVLTFVHVPTDNVYLKIAAAFAANIAGHFTHNYLSPQAALTIRIHTEDQTFVHNHKSRLPELTPTHALVLQGRFIDGKSQDQIANEMGVERTTVTGYEGAGLIELHDLVASGDSSPRHLVHTHVDLLDQLKPSSYGWILRRHYIEDVSTQDLAAELHVARSVVQYRISEALEHLRLRSGEHLSPVDFVREHEDRLPEMAADKASALRRHFIEKVTVSELGREWNVTRATAVKRLATYLKHFRKLVAANEKSPQIFVEQNERFLSRLSPRYEKILRLLYLENRLNKYVAIELGVNPSVITRQARLAFRDLQRIVSEEMPEAPSSPILKFWERWRKQSRADINPYWQNHIRHSRELILDGAEGVANKKVALIIGAGECSDIPLHQLTEMFESVHLVDIDLEALRAAQKKLPFALRSRVHLHQMDLSAGADIRLAREGLDIINEADNARTALARLKTLYEGPVAAPDQTPLKNFKADYVISSLTATQISRFARETHNTSFRMRFGQHIDPDLFAPYVRNLRQRHLELLADVTTVDGRIYIATAQRHNPTRPFDIDAVSDFLQTSPWAKNLSPEIRTTLKMYFSFMTQQRVPKLILPLLAALRFGRTHEDLKLYLKTVPPVLASTLNGAHLTRMQSIQLIEVLTKTFRADTAAIPQLVPAGFEIVGERHKWEHISDPADLISIPVHAAILRRPPVAPARNPIDPGHGARTWKRLADEIRKLEKALQNLGRRLAIRFVNVIHTDELPPATITGFHENHLQTYELPSSAVRAFMTGGETVVKNSPFWAPLLAASKANLQTGRLLIAEGVDVSSSRNIIRRIIYHYHGHGFELDTPRVGVSLPEGGVVSKKTSGLPVREDISEETVLSRLTDIQREIFLRDRLVFLNKGEPSPFDPSRSPLDQPVVLYRPPHESIIKTMDLVLDAYGDRLREMANLKTTSDQREFVIDHLFHHLILLFRDHMQLFTMARRYQTALKNRPDLKNDPSPLFSMHIGGGLHGKTLVGLLKAALGPNSPLDISEQSDPRLPSMGGDDSLFTGTDHYLNEFEEVLDHVKFERGEMILSPEYFAMLFGEHLGSIARRIQERSVVEIFSQDDVGEFYPSKFTFLKIPAVLGYLSDAELRNFITTLSTIGNPRDKLIELHLLTQQVAKAYPAFEAAAKEFFVAGELALAAPRPGRTTKPESVDRTRAAYEMMPDNSVVQLHFLRALTARAMDDEARVLIQKIDEKQLEDFQLVYFRVLSYVLGRTEAKPWDDETWTHIAVLQEERGEYSSAVTSYSNALKKDPNDPHLRTAYLKVLFQAAPPSEIAREIESAQKNGDVTEEQWRRLADLFHESGDENGAAHATKMAEDLNRIERLSEELMVGDEAWGKKDFVAAAEAYCRALKIDPRHDIAMSSAISAAQKIEDKIRALETWREILRAAPRDESIKASIAKLEREIGAVTPALPMFVVASVAGALLSGIGALFVIVLIVRIWSRPAKEAPSPLLDLLKDRKPGSYDLAHAFDTPKSSNATIVHMNEAAELEDLRTISRMVGGRRADALIVIASDEIFERANTEMFAFRLGKRGVVVRLSELPVDPETHGYRYDDVLALPHVLVLPGLKELVRNGFRDGQITVVSRNTAPFSASQPLAKIIQVIFQDGDTWLRMGLDNVLAAFRNTQKAA